MRWMPVRGLVIAMAVAAGGGEATAQAAVPVDVTDAWVRAPAPEQKVAGAYMDLVSRGNLVLVNVTSPVAGSGEIHSTTVEEGVMKMRPVGRLELPSGKTVRLAPGGLHIMLIDLKQPLKTGAKVPLALTVQRADFSRVIFTIEAEVRAAPPAKGSHQHH